MPCLILNTNQALEEEQKTRLCLAVSAATAKLLGKPESYVMVLVKDQQSMSFAGTTEAAAYIELKSINLPEDRTAELSQALCSQTAEYLDINQNRIYIEFSNAQRHMWGWDGRTF